MQNQNVKTEKGTQTKNNDIIEVILKDHEPLKELIEIMKDSDKELSERKAAFDEFVPLLIAHAKPEEQALYIYMKSKEDTREEALEGDVEHGLADQLVEECKRTTDEDLLSARIKVLAELVEHHIEEEEDELLPAFKKNSNAQDRAKLAEKFLKLKIDYLAAGDENIIPDPQLN